MKYLILEDFSGQAVPFIFPRRVDHADMREQLPYSKVISAGFIEFDSDQLSCYGGNVELGVESGSDDAKLVYEFLRKR